MFLTSTTEGPVYHLHCRK